MEEDGNEIAILSKVARLMTHNFNDLKTHSDWEKLFGHLMVKARLCKEEGDEIYSEILHNWFGNEVVNAVALLLQGLTPVRFAFLDGQCRITSLYYFQRKIIPRLEGGFDPLLEATKLGSEEIRQRWTLSKTGTLAKCTVHLVLDNPTPALAKSEISDLKAASLEIMRDLMNGIKLLAAVVPNNLSDCVGQMIDESPYWERIPDAMQLAQTGMTDMFKHVLLIIYRYENLLPRKLFTKLSIPKELYDKPDDFVKFVYNKIYTGGKIKLFPSLKSRLHNGSAPELMVLMLVLGVALVKDKAMESLRRCINKEWIVPIVEARQVNDIPIERLHPATYVNFKHEITWYKSNLYAVSDQSNSCLSLAFFYLVF